MPVRKDDRASLDRQKAIAELRRDLVADGKRVGTLSLDVADDGDAGGFAVAFALARLVTAADDADDGPLVDDLDGLDVDRRGRPAPGSDERPASSENPKPPRSHA